MRFLRNVIRALKYNRKKHIPASEFIHGVEDRWGRPLDESSRTWLATNRIAVELLHQMLNGRLVCGDSTVDHRVFFVFIDKMFLSSSNMDPSILKGKEAFFDILDKFQETHPDAAALVSYGFKAFLKNDEQA